jgi:hypothetical protein
MKIHLVGKIYFHQSFYQFILPSINDDKLPCLGYYIMRIFQSVWHPQDVAVATPQPSGWLINQLETPSFIYLIMSVLQLVSSSSYYISVLFLNTQFFEHPQQNNLTRQ